MNANELADRLDKISYDCTIEEWRASPVGEAAAKLRQQQESIEGLTRDYDLLFAEHQLLLKKEWVGLTDEEIKAFDTWHDNREEEVGWCNPSEIVAYIEAKLKEKNMKSEQIKHSLSVGIKSIQSRVFDRETDAVISFVKIPIKDSSLVRCEKGTREMNNEPVAYVDNVWINRPDLAMDLGIGQMFSRCQLSDHQIPLYTHPVKEQDCYGDGNVYRGVRSKDSEVQTIYFNPVKEQLTDEEIKSCWNWETDCQEWAIEFARAILRKAQEK